MKTPISYYGGKQAIKHHILPLIPPHEVYTEVFFGGGTVFFEKEPSFNETINDNLHYVVNFYKVLKTRFTELKVLIDATLMSRVQHREALDMLKKKRESTPVELAWAFWFCCNFSFANKIGGGPKYSNTMCTSVPRILRNKKTGFTELLVERLENVNIECSDAIKVLKSRDTTKAFHYIDPPYIGADMGHYGGYTKEDFSLLLSTLPTLKGKFLLSHYPNKELDSYIKKYSWNRLDIHIRLKAPRKSNPVKHEVLVWNYNNDKLNLFSDLDEK